MYSGYNLAYNDDLRIKLEIKFEAHSYQGSHSGQLDFCNWVADSSTTG